MSELPVHETNGAAPKAPPFQTLLRWLGRLFRLALLVTILGVSGAVSWHWMSNPPTTERRPPEAHATLVEVTPVDPAPARVVVRAMGTVVPAREIQVAARIAGQVREVSPEFVPGGRFRAGDRMLAVDKKDYELAVAQQEGNLTRAEAEVTLEGGQQAVSRREFELLGGDATDEELELLLRRPQQASKKAAVATARAALDKARVDLERTTISAPFNATVRERRADLGAYVAPGTTLATLTGTDEYWVEVSVPVGELPWIAFPETSGGGGSPARVYDQAAWGEGAFRPGAVVRLLPGIETQGRMARLLVAVRDPLGMESEEARKHPLLLDAFVRVEIEGAEMPPVVRVPRPMLHEGGKVWVMLPDKTLDIRDVSIVWGADDAVYVSGGLDTGDLLVTSEIGAAVPGMALRTAEDGGPDRPRRGAGP